MRGKELRDPDIAKADASITTSYRIKILKNEDAPFPFSWRMFEQDAAEPFLKSHHDFRSDKTAVRDAVAFLKRHNKHGVVER